MLPASSQYLAFVGLLFIVWWIAARVRGRGLVLAVAIAANCLFEWRWSWIYLLLIPACAALDYILGRAVHASSRPSIRRLFVLTSVLVNTALIVSTKLPDHAVPLSLPISLSFYGFQAMTYTIDIYRRDARPAPSFARYFASVAFFPTTLAGPITRVSSLVAQWDKLKPLSDSDGGRALFLIALGLAKKFLIADYLAEHLVNRVFDTPALYSAPETLLAVYGYTFQLYYDFSGYTDIALGTALLLGLRLPINFNRPYEALNPADFWRRWHISLSNWLRDYLFFSLPGKRSHVMPYLNLIVTMLIGGLWHGLSWTFVVWGALHGVGLAVARGWQSWRGNRRNNGTFAGRLVARIATFHFVVLGWVFFRAPTVPGAVDVVRRIASLEWGMANISSGFVMILAAAVILHYLPAGWYQWTRTRFERAPALAQATILAALATGVQYVAATGSVPFVYQRF